METDDLVKKTEPVTRAEGDNKKIKGSFTIEY
jgi:hypothetical protein